jgi:hypothetical protein
MEVGLEISTEKTKYMFPSPHQDAGQNHENMAHFKYLGTTGTRVTH